MLNKLNADVLSNVFARIVSPIDYLNTCLSCKNIHNFLQTRCTDVVVYLKENTSLIFFSHMQGLRVFSIVRKYDYFIDFTPLYKNKLLKIIFVNNPQNIFNIPRRVQYLYGYQTLISDEIDLFGPLSDAEDDDIDIEILSLKEYSTDQYKNKKYSKLKFKHKSYHVKTRHLVGSI
jgi:hypothetical protein